LSAGKPYYDLMQALRDLNVSNGLRIGKVGMPFPLEPDFVRDFASGLETIFVVEEKRSFLEMQLREILYDSPARPVIFGKSHLPATGELDPDKIAKALCSVLDLAPRKTAARLEQAPPVIKTENRPPAFCSGCPHN